MAAVATLKDYCVFVGGSGTKAGVAEAGGCTLAWLKAKNYNPSVMFGTNGACLYSALIDNGPVLSGSDWIFSWPGASTIEVGMCAWIVEKKFFTTSARYEITSIPTANHYITGYVPSYVFYATSFVASTKKIYLQGEEVPSVDDKISISGSLYNNRIFTVTGDGDDEGDFWITVSETVVSESGLATIVPAVDVYVGGAYSGLVLASAPENILADTFNVFVFTNKNETLAATIIPAGGSVAKMTWVKIIGYNTTCLDMREGGTYYESAFTVHKNGAPDVTKCVELNCNAGNFHGLSIVGVSNIQIENLYFYNTSKATTPNEKQPLVFSGTIYNFVAVNCRFDKGNRACYTNPTAGFWLFDCWIGNDWQETGTPAVDRTVFACITGVFVANCVLGGNLTNGMFVITGSTLTVINSIFYRSGKCVHPTGAATSKVFLSKCNLIDFRVAVVDSNIANMGVVLEDSICVANSVAIPIMSTTVNHTGMLKVSHCNFVAANGSPLTDKYALQAGQSDPEEVGVIEVDPQFVNYAGRDYQLNSSSPCKGTGTPRGGKETDMGAIPTLNVCGNGVGIFGGKHSIYGN